MRASSQGAGSGTATIANAITILIVTGIVLSVMPLALDAASFGEELDEQEQAEMRAAFEQALDGTLTFLATVVKILGTLAGGVLMTAFGQHIAHRHGRLSGP